MTMSCRRGLILLWAMGAVTLQAQTNAPAPAAQPVDLDRAVQYYEHVERVLQERVQAINDDLKNCDQAMENLFGRLLQTVCQVTDSQDSGTRVLQLKEQMFDGMKRNLEMLVRERGTRFAQLYQMTPRLQKADLVDDIRRLNVRIEKRVDQMMALVESLPGAVDIPRQIISYDDDDTHRRTNPQYTHQSRVQGRAGVLREKAETALKASVAKQDRVRLELERAHRAARTAEGRQFIEELQQLNAELVARRREQIALSITGAQRGGQALGKDAANALGELLNEEKLNLQRDLADWTRLKNARDVERERLALCQRRLKYYRQQRDAVARTGTPAAPGTTKVP